MNDNYCPRCERELWTLFSFLSCWRLMWQCRNRALVANEAHKKGVRWEVFPFFGQVWGKKGVKNQNGNDICHQRWPALCQPLMRRSQRKPGRVRSELQICTVLALFKGGQAGQGMVPTHTLSVIQPPTTNTHPPHFPTNLSLPEWPQS